MKEEAPLKHARRHLAEVEDRIEEQELLIVRLRDRGMKPRAPRESSTE